MEFFLRGIMWFILLLSIFFIPVCLFLFLSKYFSKRIVLGVSSFILVAYLFCLSFLSSKPFVFVPSEYQDYVDELKREEIQSYNSGMYSMNIPFIPIVIHVQEASDEYIRVSTTYFPFGSTTMTFLEEDVPSLDSHLFEW